jgi:hypothetical protein
MNPDPTCTYIYKGIRRRTCCLVMIGYVGNKSWDTHGEWYLRLRHTQTVAGTKTKESPLSARNLYISAHTHPNTLNDYTTTLNCP